MRASPSPTLRARPILRTSLRQQVYSSLFGMLLEGRWDHDSRLNDSALAAELGVSRTPVREALIQLESEGLLVCDPNRGFSLPALRAEEAREIYPILWSLEQLAVYLSAAGAQDVRKKLEEANGRPSSAGAASASKPPLKPGLKDDRAWHAVLVEASGNRKLIEMTARVEALSRRYAVLVPHDPASAERRSREHTQIAEALATEQPARAFALLKMHWRAEMEDVLRAMETRASTPPAAPAEKARRSSAAAGRS